MRHKAAKEVRVVRHKAAEVDPALRREVSEDDPDDVEGLTHAVEAITAEVYAVLHQSTRNPELRLAVLTEIIAVDLAAAKIVDGSGGTQVFDDYVEALRHAVRLAFEEYRSDMETAAGEVQEIQSGD